MTEPANHLAEAPPKTFRFDFKAFETMDAAGVFARTGRRVELLEGEVIEMSPASNDHAVIIASLALQLGNGLRDASLDGLQIGAGGTLRIDDWSAPEPDLYVIRKLAERRYADASDALLVVEVSISTQDVDCRVKRPLYARAGIPELWIVEPDHRRIRVFREPEDDGRWGSETVISKGLLTPTFSDHVRVTLGDLF